MAQPKVPPVEELLSGDPESYLRKISKLPAPLVEVVKDQLEHLLSQLGVRSNIPTTPIEMAIRNPRYRWMDLRHLRFLGEIVTESIELLQPTIVCMPPRNCKTTTVGVWTPFWALARNPELSILYVSYEKNFARKWGLRVRQLIELYGAEYGLKLSTSQTAADNWKLESGGGMECVGAGGGISGKDAKLLICDDLVKDDEAARSDLQRDNLWDWWESTVIQRIEPDTAVFVIGTRWHEDDIIGRLLAHSKTGEGMDFRLVSLPALAMENDPLGRSPGDPLWPDRFSKEWCEKRRERVSPYVWSAVYQQLPSPPGGNMVDPEWWRFYRPTELPTDFDQMIQTWDLGLDAKTKKDSYHCGGVLGRLGALVYLLEIYREHSDINKVIEKILDWNQRYPKARTKLVERAISGPAVAQMLQHRVSGMTPWPPKGQRKDSKEACLNAIIPDIRSGNVLLPLTFNGSRSRVIDEFIDELRQFPRAPHDDQVDMVSQGVSFLLPSARRAIDAAHAEALDTRRTQTVQEEQTRALHSHIAQIAKPRMDALKRIQRAADRSPIPFLTIDGGKLRERGRSTPKMW